MKKSLREKSKRKFIKIADDTLDIYKKCLSLSGQQINSVFIRQAKLFYFPTVCEYICDVEIALKEGLSSGEFEHFEIYIKNEEFENDEKIKERTDIIKYKISRILIQKSLHRIKDYTIKKVPNENMH